MVASPQPRNAASTVLLAFLAGCALQGGAAEESLRTDALDQECLAAVSRFREAVGDGNGIQTSEEAALALAAADRLFDVVDVRIQRSLAEAVQRLSRPTMDEILAAESELPDALRQEVVSLSATGVEAADAALAFEPSVAAHQSLALHLTMLAWANGAVRALMAGYGSRIQSHVDQAIELDPGWDGAAPLRLRGRFLAQAPWPVGDLEAARRDLERAVAIAPLPIHHLFLGDVLYALDDAVGAKAEWQRVLESEPDAATKRVYPFHQTMARARLEADG